jgi:hypothetical protein
MPLSSHKALAGNIVFKINGLAVIIAVQGLKYFWQNNSLRALAKVKKWLFFKHQLMAFIHLRATLLKNCFIDRHLQENKNNFFLL